MQGKDALNAIGIGAFFNLMNFGQMFGFHVFLLPALLVVFVLVVVFAGVFSSADEPPLTLQQYAQQNPVGFATTAMGG